MKNSIIILALFAISRVVFAQTPAMIFDGNISPLGNNPTMNETPVIITNAVFPDGVVIFKSNDGTNGVELWRSSGTVASTTLIKDISVGAKGSNPLGFVNLNASTVLFWAANTPSGSKNLWKTDGTTAGTDLVYDFGGSMGSFPLGLVHHNGLVYFSDGVALWKTDGTTAGTMLVYSFFPTTNEGGLQTIISTPNGLFVTTNPSPLYNYNLWKSDGTTAGTVFLKEFSYINLAEDNTIGNQLFLMANDGISGYELWKTDGTIAGTALVKDIGNGSSGAFPSFLTILNNTLYFSGFGNLWKSDGTDAGTVQISSLAGYNMQNIGGRLYFYDSNTASDVYESNTTATTFTLIKSFPRFSQNNVAQPQFIGANGLVYFDGISKNEGHELWQYTPNSGLPILVKDIRLGIYGSSPQYWVNNPNPNNPSDFYFFANDGTTGFELYKYQGNTAFPPVLTRDIEPNYFSSSPTESAKLNDYYLYRAIKPNNFKIFSINTSNSSLSPVELSLFDPSNMLTFNNKVYFQANSSTSSINLELYSTDGISTSLIKDINPSGIGSLPAEMTTVGSIFFFAAEDAANGRELWKSDGTTANTVLVKNIRNSSNSSSPNHLREFGGALYFFASGQGVNYRLWKSDGTDANTVEISPTVLVDAVNGLIEKTSSHLFVTSNNATIGNELYVLNGTSLTLLKDINVGTGSSNPANFTAIGNILYFTATNGTFDGIELWKTDGTTAGTVMVKNINLLGSSFPQNLYNFNGTLYFSANNTTHGIELWKSDGTESGTVLVKDINPDLNADSNPAGFCAVGNTLYFAATHPKHGRELWKTDGTAAGTVLVYDLFENYQTESNDAYPTNLFNMNGTLFFSANNGINGTELHSLKPCESTKNFNQFTFPRSSTYQVLTDMTAAHKIQYGRQVNYFAGESVLLSPGFSVSANDAISTDKNVFRVEIRACN